MSDTQRDREERQHVIEVLQNMLDWMEAINYIVATPERRHALGYAIASIKTDLKYDLLYEETSGQADKQADKPTTKNDVPDINVVKIGSTTNDNLGVDYLGVDWESYKDVDGNSLDDLILEVLQNNFDCGNTYGYKVADEIIELLPSVTPQEPFINKPCVSSGVCEHDKLKVLEKIREQMKSHLRGVEITLEVLVEGDPLRPKMEGAKDTLEECLELIDRAESEEA